MREPVTANRLIVVLCAYFAVLLGAAAFVGVVSPEALPLLPLGGNDVLEIVGIEAEDESFLDSLGSSRPVVDAPATGRQVGLLALFLGFSLGGTVLVMLPVTWTYPLRRSPDGCADPEQPGPRFRVSRNGRRRAFSSGVAGSHRWNLHIRSNLRRPGCRYRAPRDRGCYGYVLLPGQYSALEDGLRSQSDGRPSG